MFHYITRDVKRCVTFVTVYSRLYNDVITHQTADTDTDSSSEWDAGTLTSKMHIYKSLWKQQSRVVFNAAARLVFSARKSHSSVNYTGWKFRREFSSCYVISHIVALTARRHHTSLRRSTWLPTYVGSRRSLRSASASTLVVPSTRRTMLGDQAFPVAAARACNALPPSVRSVPSLLQFRRDLKTSLFQSSYSSP